jgi:hypothetical protein
LRRLIFMATIAAPIFSIGCGGAQHAVVAPKHACAKPMRAVPETDDPTPPSGPQPIEVSATSARDNGLIRVDVSAVGHGHTAQEGFEEPSAWRVTASADGQEMRRLVLGPVRVERCPTGDVHQDSWDVKVEFSMYYQMPDQEPKQVAVALTAPDESNEHQFTLTVPPAPAADAVGPGLPHHARAQRRR